MKVTTITPKYKLLKPVTTSPGEDNIRLYSRPLSINELEKYILKPASRDLVAIDIETRGLSPFYPHIYREETYSPCIVGIGLAYPFKGGYKAAYFDPRQQSEKTMKHFYKRLGDLYLVAHNAMFDGLWLRKTGLDLGVDVRPNWVADTFPLFKDMSGSDYKGQTHGLKDAQVGLLGWDSKGDVELDNHLIELGYYTESGKKGERVKRARKGEMWRADFDILGTYCCYDTISTLQLFDKVFEPVMKKFPMFWDYHETAVIGTIHELIDQQIRGIRIDAAGLTNEYNKMQQQVEELQIKFCNHPEIQPHLLRRQQEEISKLTVPPEFKKNGEVSKNFLKYKEKVNTLLQDPLYNFNPGSDTQLRWLFYDNLFSFEKIEIQKYYRTEVKYKLLKETPVELPATDSGLPPIDKKALPHLGVGGEILMEIGGYTKLMEYIHSYLEANINNRMHPGWKVPATITGRLAGVAPNLLQVAKDPRKLSYILPDEGYIFCSADFSSIENVILAELSRDKSLLYLYGPDAKPNCGYLFTGAHIPGLKEEICKYYDPYNPTQESVSLAKKKAKKYRSIAKVIVLSSQYGASAPKIHETLNLQGIKISLREVEEIHASYWELYKGVEVFQNYLLDQWNRNRGYIFNGIERPVSVGDHHLKDLVNRSCQSTGSDITKLWTVQVAKLVRERKLDAHPAIFNFHDETIWNVRPDQVEDLKQVYKDACDYINNMLINLGWVCLLKVDPSVGNNLWEIKND